jgi:hypothetical protein
MFTSSLDPIGSAFLSLSLSLSLHFDECRRVRVRVHVRVRVVVGYYFRRALLVCSSGIGYQTSPQAVTTGVRCTTAPTQDGNTIQQNTKETHHKY